MLLVILGTQDKQFTRLLDAVRAQIEAGVIQEDVVVQAGQTRYACERMQILDFIPYERLQTLMTQARAVITHAGAGSMVECLRLGKKVIVAARLKRYHEHTNDHQLQLQREFARMGYVLALEDFADLGRLLAELDTFEPQPYSSNTGEIFEAVMEDLERFLE